MTWNATARTLAILLTCSGVALNSARADDGPPPALEAPAGDGPATPVPIPAPTAPKPATAPAAPPRDDRAVLALPGITAPSSRSPRLGPTITTADLPPPSLGPTSDGGLPPLEMPGARPNQAGPIELIPLPSERFRGRIVDSIPIDATLPPLEVPPIRPGSSRPRGTTTTDRDRSILDDPIDLMDIKDRDKSAKEDDKPLPPPPRRSGLFSRFMLRPTSLGSDSAIKAEPRSDAAADAEIKRRLERQASAAVGDRTKAIEVRVVGRSITIQARGVKFLQKRAVRRSLETLPGLTGYRSVVEIVD